jgi:flagellar motor switch protein FliN/FliY
MGVGPLLSQTAKYNLELLLEVELDLSVSFGETVLPLQDVLKLASGSIVELNRSAADPVDLLVNNSVIARGEVVVVDGNYGVRVTEIVSRKERIRSIF